MKRMILVAMLLCCAPLLAWCQGRAMDDELRTDEWMICSMTPGKIGGLEGTYMDYNFRDVTVYMIDGSVVTDLGQLRFPMLAEVQYTVDNDVKQLRTIRVKIEYRTGIHGLLYPLRWVPEYAADCQSKQDFVNGLEQR